MITYTDANMRFPDGTVALEKVSFTVPKGQFCVLLGSSGAGKSTLLKAANGMVRLTGGTVHIGEERMDQRNRRRLQQRIAMIHQHFNLVERLDVESNVISAAIASLPLWRVVMMAWPRKLRREAALLIEEMGFSEEHLRRRCSDLSGGQQQRIGIARAFLMNPDLVLADEPVASLDPTTSHGVLELLRSKASDSKTSVLCSLHQVEFARQFADRIIGLRAGQLVFDGPPEELDEKTVSQLYYADR